jgi:hypothetical protein
MNIQTPFGLVDCLCGATGKVCVKGDGAVKNGQLAIKVYGKIYQPPSAPPNPSSGPPAGTPSARPDHLGRWCLGVIGGAVCVTEPGPYVNNTIWGWAEYLDHTGATTYTVVNQIFQGKCVDGLGVCCSSSSSSSHNLAAVDEDPAQTDKPFGQDI